MLKPYSRAGLQRAAEYYLARYASSSANLREVLRRKLRRRGSEAGGEEEEAAWVEATVTEMQRLGYVNDETYAGMQMRSLRRRGASRRGIAQKLSAKGIGREQIASLLDEEEEQAEDGEAVEMQAAMAYLRRSRRGPFRTSETTPELRQKDMQALARQGYSFETARAALEQPAGV